MLGTLLKKQLTETFRAYIYNPKTNSARSKLSIALFFAFYLVVMIGVLGGMFTALSLSVCGAMVAVGMDWLFFCLLGGLAILIGIFGSVFNTYSSLYLSKDNDLLLSLPIPVRIIVASRLLNVYLMGASYAATAILPAVIVYWVVKGITVANVIGGVVLTVLITLIVFLLSCILGWVVAKISVKLKNKSFVTVLISLIFIGAYYFFYFKAQSLVADLIQNVVLYGERIKGAAYPLYLFGRIGGGDLIAAAVFAAIFIALTLAVWLVLLKTFLKIAISTGNTARVRTRQRAAHQRSAFRALLRKEFARFTASPLYMLNCGLGVVVIPLIGAALLWKGPLIVEAVNTWGIGSDTLAVLLGIGLPTAAMLIDPAAPSVSLESKTLWVVQSLPVAPPNALRAKIVMNLLLSAPVMLFTAVCAAVVLPLSPLLKVCIVAFTLLSVIFQAVFFTFLSAKMVNLNWTNEIVPIKQSAAVFVALFGSMGLALVQVGLYFWCGRPLGAIGYLAVWAVLLIAATAFMFRWLHTAGARRYAFLG